EGSSEDDEDDEDDDMDIEANEEEEEEHLAPADSIVVASIVADQAASAEKTEPFETDDIIRLRDEAASTSSPPLQLPSASRMEDRPEVTLPPHKRLGIALGPRYEVGESSSVATARPAGGLRADYGFVATMDREIMHACDLVYGEVMSLRTTVLGQMSKIRELQATDHRRQTVISELLRT
nr:hypothetical protein [Tanacetum cinerariifolium]